MEFDLNVNNVVGIRNTFLLRTYAYSKLSLFLFFPENVLLFESSISVLIETSVINALESNPIEMLSLLIFNTKITIILLVTHRS